jgi:predicted ATP-binding protein involved in virulence
MRVKSINVTGLFGLFDHDIPLQNSDRVTIIHGPNGFGKTVMLKMIAALAAGNTAIFRHTPFKEFSFALDDGTSCIIRRRTDKTPDHDKPDVSLEFLQTDSAGTRTEARPLLGSLKLSERVLAIVDRHVPGPYTLIGSMWADGRGNSYNLDDIIQMFPQAAKVLPKDYRPAPFFDACKGLEVFFVGADRLRGQPRWAGPEIESVAPDLELMRRSETQRSFPGEAIDQPALQVQNFSEDIVQRIKKVLTDYASRSQESDRTFPERLVRFVGKKRSAVPEHEILDRLNKLEKKTRRLIALGLLDPETGPREFTPEDVKRAPEALEIYVGDIEKKLNVFDDIADRINTLLEIVNARFQYKGLKVSREEGFRVLSDSKETVELQDLSSGEQHELVVLYELLFRGPKSGLVLIDEPEISLHVGWQVRFLNDLINILRSTDAYAIVATHAPLIFSKRRDLAVELMGPKRSKGAGA